MILPVRCAHCARVRFSPELEWEDHPGRLEGEVVGICETCMGALKRKQRISHARMKRTGEQRKARGFGPGTGDPFAGMRGDK